MLFQEKQATKTKDGWHLERLNTLFKHRIIAPGEGCTTRRCKGGGGGNMYKKYMHMKWKEDNAKAFSLNGLGRWLSWLVSSGVG